MTRRLSTPAASLGVGKNRLRCRPVNLHNVSTLCICYGNYSRWLMVITSNETAVGSVRNPFHCRGTRGTARHRQAHFLCIVAFCIQTARADGHWLCQRPAAQFDGLPVAIFKYIMPGRV